MGVGGGNEMRGGGGGGNGMRGGGGWEVMRMDKVGCCF